MIAAAQLDVLIARPVRFTDEEAAAFNAIALPTEEQAASDLGADKNALAGWLATIGITGPPPRVAHVATAVATAARRVAALAAQG